MNKNVLLMVDVVSNEKGVEQEIIFEALEAALASASKEHYGADGINLDDCARVSREVAATLDVEDPIRQSYQLEVSSPGMDRPLAKPEHFQRFRGELVRIETLAPMAGNRRRFRGTLLDATDRDVTLQMPEGPVTLAYADIEKARLVPNFENTSSEKE